MTINFKAVKKGEAGVKGGGAYMYHAAATNRKVIDTHNLSQMLADRCTVRRADVTAVLTGLSELMSELLCDGKSVQFEEIGIFSTTLVSELKHSPEEVKEGTISGVRVQFRADKELKEQLRKAVFKKVKK